MAAKIGILRRIPLNDDELDAVLSAADEELLGYVRAASSPEAALLKIMATGDNDPVPSATPGTPRPPAHPGTSRLGCRRVMATSIAAAAAIMFAAWFHAPREGMARSPETAATAIRTTVSFAPDRYSINSTARTQLSVLLEPLKIRSAFNVTIRAYTDGHLAAGRALANKRSKAIQAWLTAAAGVPSSQLHAITLVVPQQKNGPLDNSSGTVSVVLDELKCVRIGAGGPP